MPDQGLKPMKLKLDEEGHAVISDGKPVYVDEDGKEIVFDVSRNLLKIKDLNDENMAHREEKTKALESLKLWEGLDPEEARKALDTVTKLDESKLIEADKVQELEDKLKEQLNTIFKKKEDEVLKESQQKLDILNESLTTQNNTIVELMKRNHFASSPWFVSVDGNPAKNVLPPDMAADIFGKYFQVEGEGSEVRFVGYQGTEKIASQDPNKLAEPANFDEAIGILIESHQNKNSILSGTRGGPGDRNKNFDAPIDGVVKIPKEHSRNPEYYQRAKEQAEKIGAVVQIQE